MKWRPILVTVARLAVLAMVVEIGTIGVCWHWFWTPIERHYLPAYVWCSLPVITPASAEVRFVWKTGPHRKPQLASDDDADDSEDGTGMALSQSARDAGWKKLLVSPAQKVPTAKLGPALADFAYAGESLWRFLLLPEECGLVMLCYGIYGSLWLLSWLLEWAADRSWKQSPWAAASPSLLEGCAKAAQRLFFGIATLHKRAQHCIEPRRNVTNSKIAPSEPAATPPSFAISIFGVHNGTNQRFLWTEQNEIE
jgi:hypothetical protein